MEYFVFASCVYVCMHVRVSPAHCSFFHEFKVEQPVEIPDWAARSNSKGAGVGLTAVAKMFRAGIGLTAVDGRFWGSIALASGSVIQLATQAKLTLCSRA